ncbi:MAG: hypothetical protein ACW97O_07910 [Candidatus Thorarchaeota archaeon]|jgi:hypothetical protein
MPLVNFSNVNFDQIKQSLRDYLKANSNFTDYDFEGSNLSTIIDALAYNTYITSYNANMVSNEVFLDSATLRENVVSLARNIGYVPKSRKSAVANISFSVDASDTDAVTLTLKAGIVALSNKQFNGTSYVFSIIDDITVPVESTGVAFFNNVNIYEGTYVTQNWTVSSRNPNQRYYLTNSGIDTSRLKVIVRESEQSTVSRTYAQFSSLVGVTPTSTIYYLQEAPGERYELLFGDNVFGAKLQEPNYVTANYLTCNGAEANGITAFTYAGRLVDHEGTVVTRGISLLATNSPSQGGAAIESMDSIRKYSPQIYASQNRAVTAADYEAVVPQVYPEAASVSAFGGEELNPPAYGKVFISIKPYNGVYLSSEIKQNLQSQLRKYSVAGIVTEIVDLKYLYIESDSRVYYNSNLASSAAAVKAIVNQNIVNYANSSQLNQFGARFKYSKFQNVIDNSHEAVTSNITNISMRRDMAAQLNTFAEYEICYGNRFHIKNHGHSSVYNGTIIGYNIKSSGFKVSGISDTVYFGDSPNADQKTGTIFLFKLNSATQPVILKTGIGTIDYVKGEIKLNPIKILSTVVNKGQPVIEISATPYSNDVIGLQDLYLQLDTTKTTVNMVIDGIDSGDDVSGSNYIVSSSYGNGSLVRGPIVVETTQSTSTGTAAVTTTTTVTTSSAATTSSSSY